MHSFSVRRSSQMTSLPLVAKDLDFRLSPCLVLTEIWSRVFLPCGKLLSTELKMMMMFMMPYGKEEDHAVLIKQSLTFTMGQLHADPYWMQEQDQKY